MTPIRKSVVTLAGVAFALSLVSLATAASAEHPPLSSALSEVAFPQLSDRHVTPFARAALEIRAADWRHAESANFVYHFFQSFIAAPVAVEAEAYYRMIAKDLQKDTAQWERKGHVFIFEKPEDWALFKKTGGLDPWTGGLHRGGELFIVRNPALKFKGTTLAHEIAHLVVHRFFGPGVPLWLNEGYAEYAASRFCASFHRARGFAARPQARPVSPEHFVPLETLLHQVDYGTDPLKIHAFYDESEKLVRFLSSADAAAFSAFFEALSRGSRFDTALTRSFGSKFGSLAGLERDFKIYATKDHAGPTSN